MSVDKFDLRAEVKEKERRARQFLVAHDLDALLLSRRDNFAWFTFGGDSTLVNSWAEGSATLVITREKKYLVAWIMDAQRNMDEEVAGQGFEMIAPRAYSGGPVEEIQAITRGMKVASDTPFPGAVLVGEEIIKMHYPLTEGEVARYAEIARQSGEVLEKVAMAIEPGNSELEIAAQLLQEYKERGFFVAVLLVGTDERIYKYRHPTPTAKRMEKYTLLAPAVSRYGLHVTNSRLVHFGPPPAEMVDKHRAVSTIHANMVAHCVPGKRFAELHELQRKLFDELGYPDEWNRHFQGGLTGYNLTDSAILLDPEARVQRYQSFGWYITITGVKTEELSLLEENEARILSYSPHWPSLPIVVGGRTIDIPDILVR